MLQPVEVAACAGCGERFPLATMARRRASGAEWWCSECSCEEFHFQCCRCGECGDVEDQHRLLVVLEEVPGLHKSVQPGVYRVVGAPYYGGSLIGESYLFDSALVLLTMELRGLGLDGDYGYPCGHLCLDCQHIVERSALAPGT